MKNFQEYNRLLYGETIAWLNGNRVIKELAVEEYDVLLFLLTYPKARLRWSAASRLGKLKNDRGTESLIRALQDKDWLVRLHAAKALGNIGNPTAIEPLIASMNDECAYVRRRVVSALARMKNHGSIQLTESLISALGDSDSQVRSSAAWSLREYVSFSSLTALGEAVRDPNKNVSWRAIEALQSIGVPAVKTLAKLLEYPDSETRYRAAKALGNIGNQQAIRILEDRLNDPNEKVSGRVNLALRQIKFQQWWNTLWKGS